MSITRRMPRMSPMCRGCVPGALSTALSAGITENDTTHGCLQPLFTHILMLVRRVASVTVHSGHLSRCKMSVLMNVHCLLWINDKQMPKIPRYVFFFFFAAALLMPGRGHSFTNTLFLSHISLHWKDNDSDCESHSAMYVCLFVLLFSGFFKGSGLNLVWSAVESDNSVACPWAVSFLLRVNSKPRLEACGTERRKKQACRCW